MSIAVLVDFHDLSGYHKLLLDGIHAYCSNSGLEVIFFTIGRYNSPLQSEYGRNEVKKILRQQEIRGIIVFSISLTNFSGIKPLEKELKYWKNIPIVSISLDINGCSSVLINNKPGFNALLDHLFTNHNFRNIAYVSGPESNVDSVERYNLFLDKIKEYNIDFSKDNVFLGDFALDSGINAVRYFFDELKSKPDLIICANDEMVIGVWRELKRRGLIVPQDVALTGFDDLKASLLFALPFTTVKQPLFQQGFTAAKLLNEKIESGNNENKNILLETKMILRKSCGCLIKKEQVVPIKIEKKQEDVFDYKTMFFESYRKDFIDFFKMEINTENSNALLRHWYKFLLKSIQYSINYDEIHNYLKSIADIFEKEPLYADFKKNINEYLITLNENLFEFYQLSDSLSQIEFSRKKNYIQNKVDEIMQQLVMGNDLSGSLGDIPKIMKNIDIDEFYITLYGNKKRNRGYLIFAYFENKIHVIPEEKIEYTFGNLLPKKFKKKMNSSKIILGLYQESNQIGFVSFSMGCFDYSIYELIRKKLSHGINSMMYTNNLHKMNIKLEAEIRSRKEAEYKLKEAMKRLEELSLTDELTGLYNRRGFIKIANQQLLYCRRLSIPYLVLFIDLDGLKKINDTYGHDKGDYAILTIGKTLKSSLRSIDIVSRLGGDEFTAFLTKADLGNFKTIKERIFDSLDLINEDSEELFSLSISIGCFSSQNDDNYDLIRMMKFADEILYEEKKRKYRR